MASSDRLNVRIINTHDTEANWNNTVNFVPEAGEIIIYDIDSTYSYERFKIGDGVLTVNQLPFIASTVIDEYLKPINGVVLIDAGNIATYETESEE